MPDQIRLRGVSATGFHGVLPEERRNGQVFVVDVDLVTDLLPAARTDDLGASVDYSAVAQDVVREIEGEPVNLIETLAERIAARCLRRPRVAAVRVTVHKPEAPVGVPVRDGSVTIERSR